MSSFGEVESEDIDGVRIAPEARTFVVLSTTVSLAAFDLGFDLGAFDNVDHRKVWAIWILSFVAFVASFLFRDRDYRLGGRWMLALGLPTIWLVADAFLVLTATPVVLAFVALSLMALPFAVYVLVRLVAGEYFRLTPRLRIALAVNTVVVLSIGWLIGANNDRFMTCRDFDRAGEYVPIDCRSDDASA